MENKMDISYLFEKPSLDKKIILKLLPLAPLSIVKNLPGSFYKTEKAPDKFVLSGLIENLIGLHIEETTRYNLFKKMKKYLKKVYKFDLKTNESNVGYLPLVYNLFEIEEPILIPNLIHYNDYWTQHVIAGDKRHLDGVINYDWKLEQNIVRLKDSEKTEYFKDNRSLFPKYYRTMQQREFIICDGSYLIKMKINKSLLSILQKAISKNNSGYLGTNEGWVHVTIGEEL